VLLNIAAAYYMHLHSNLIDVSYVGSVLLLASATALMVVDVSGPQEGVTHELSASLVIRGQSAYVHVFNFTGSEM